MEARLLRFMFLFTLSSFLFFLILAVHSSNSALQAQKTGDFFYDRKHGNPFCYQQSAEQDSFCQEAESGLNAAYRSRDSLLDKADAYYRDAITYPLGCLFLCLGIRWIVWGKLRLPLSPKIKEGFEKILSKLKKGKRNG